MDPILNKNLFLVKERVGLLRSSNHYDILDPESRQVIITCTEQKMDLFSRILRFTSLKNLTPFTIDLSNSTGKKLLTLKKGLSVFFSDIDVLDEEENKIGRFEQKVFTIGSSFYVVDANDREICSVRGDWTGWDFYFEGNGVQYAHITKKWAGVGKELLTSADMYSIEIKDTVPPESTLRQLILGAVICIDMVFKEKSLTL